MRKFLSSNLFSNFICIIIAVAGMSAYFARLEAREDARYETLVNAITELRQNQDNQNQISAQANARQEERTDRIMEILKCK